MTYDLVLYLLNSEINGIFNTCMYDLLSENITECPEGQYMDHDRSLCEANIFIY